MEISETGHPLAQGVLEVLSGTPLESAASCVGVETGHLEEAVQAYTEAGATALQIQAEEHGWHQAHIEFTDWQTAETTVTERLTPRLHHAEQSGLVDSWWFIRKAPCWRLRLRLSDTTTPGDELLKRILDDFSTPEATIRWRRTVYEPETLAFGGPEAMHTAHDLFHTDSRAILDYLNAHATVLGRRELSTMLCGALFRGADQDEFEQGDIWHRITRMRPLPEDVPPERMPELSVPLRRLLTAHHPTQSPDNPLVFTAPWILAFASAGQALSQAAHTGTLQRGLRAVLAHHVIFHWNRIGLPARTQSILAHAARTALMDTEPGSAQGARC
ncbi:thiopeptide-type bacteriocin biosynthesis protein [Nocardiopsis sp. NPDC055879]